MKRFFSKQKLLSTLTGNFLKNLENEFRRHQSAIHSHRFNWEFRRVSIRSRTWKTSAHFSTRCALPALHLSAQWIKPLRQFKPPQRGVNVNWPNWRKFLNKYISIGWAIALEFLMVLITFMRDLFEVGFRRYIDNNHDYSEEFVHPYSSHQHSARLKGSKVSESHWILWILSESCFWILFESWISDWIPIECFLVSQNNKNQNFKYRLGKTLWILIFPTPHFFRAENELRKQR